MIAKARQLSDIRAKSAPAFRLSVEFSFANMGLATVEGPTPRLGSLNLRRKLRRHSWEINMPMEI
jgi:hypothetical protein